MVSSLPSPADLPGKWRLVATDLRRWGGAVPAEAIERCAAELQEAIEAEQSRLLTLDEAAVISGYSRDHLGRQVSTGRIPNAGRRHAPRIRIADLPKKAGKILALPKSAQYDPAADARDLLAG
jgi:hypothetical protein